MKLIILCDFDGTIVNFDTAIFILKKYTKDKWKYYEKLYEQGKISIEDAMNKQFQEIKINLKKKILLHLEREIKIREGFNDFVNFCSKKSIEIVIVSAGIDFVIKHLLKFQNKKNDFKIISPKTILSESKMELEFPELKFEDSFDFKEDTVLKYQEEGFSVAFIGDGIVDYYAIKKSNFGFVVKNSPLALRMEKNNIPFFEFTNFKEVITELNKIIEQI
ncbi:MAG: HAD-IB family phosphatase [Candidatus Ranarchaeia archaeon]